MTAARTAAAAAMALLTAVCLLLDPSWPMVLLALCAVGLATLTAHAVRREGQRWDGGLTLWRDLERTPCEQGAHYFQAHQAVWVCAECGHRQPRNTLVYDQETSA